MTKMKSLITLIAFFVTFQLMAQTPGLEGIWFGSLDVGVKLRIVFDIKKAGAGYVATMDSPDQNAKGLKVGEVTLAEKNVHMDIAVAGGLFDGVLMNDTTIVGEWKQGPGNLPLTLIKSVNILEGPKRPQTPKPPFSYSVEEVSYSSADKSVKLSGTFTYPAAGNQFPTAILITGSGQQDRDETIFSHKPFAVIADYLTNKGYAVLRVDDRGKGSSTGNVVKATSEDFAHDVALGIQYLKTRAEVDTNTLGLIGHSEGGYIAAYLASTRKDINFIILLAGPGVKGLDLMAEQNSAYLQSSGISANTANLYKTLYSEIGNALLTSNDTATAMRKAWTSYKAWASLAPQASLAALGLVNDEVAKMNVSALIGGFSSPWMNYFLQCDASKHLEKTKAAVLALNGAKDIQVIADQNINGIKKALEKSKSRTYQTRIFPDLNHLFQHCVKCTVPEYAEVEETFSPEVLQEMGKWLDQNVKTR